MHTAKTHTILHGLIAAALVVALAGPGAAAVKKTAYPEVKVTLDKPYKPDAAFEKMHAAFLDAVKRKDLQALTALVAPTFLWTVGDTPADDLDLGRDAVHNFKVAFGFRGLGKDVDGGVDNGPYWDVLTSFADDATYYAATDSGNLVCGPIAAEVADDRIFEQAPCYATSIQGNNVLCTFRGESARSTGFDFIFTNTGRPRPPAFNLPPTITGVRLICE